MKSQSPEHQLAAFIGRYTPEIGTLAEAVLARMRARLPGEAASAPSLER